MFCMTFHKITFFSAWLISDQLVYWLMLIVLQIKTIFHNIVRTYREDFVTLLISAVVRSLLFRIWFGGFDSFTEWVVLGIAWRLLRVTASGFARWDPTTTGRCWWAAATIRQHVSGSSARLSARRNWENTTTSSSVLRGRPTLPCSTLPRRLTSMYVAFLYWFTVHEV